MKIPIPFQAGPSATDENGLTSVTNFYVQPEVSGKHKEILMPTPGIDSDTLTTLTGSTGNVRGGVVDASTSSPYWASGRSIHDSAGTDLSGAVLTATTTYVQMVSGGTSTSHHILVNDTLSAGGTGNMFAVSTDYDTVWKLDDTSLQTATPTSTGTNQLIDAAGTFVSNGVLAGMTVENSTAGTYAFITNVTASTLTLSADIFPNTTDTYDIRTSYGLPPTLSNSIAYMDGYYIVADNSNPGRFYVSKLYDINRWSALDFATAERSPDTIISIIVNKRELWLFGEHTTEIWWNSGNSAFPFEPIQSGFLNVGCESPNSAIATINDIYWVRSDGAGIVKSQGLGFVPVSTPEIDVVLDAARDANGTIIYSEAQTFSYKGNTFVTFQPSVVSNSIETLLLNTTTGLWSFWSSFYGTKDRQYVGRVILDNTIGFANSNETGEFNWDSSFENGVAIKRELITPVLADSGKTLRHSALQLDCSEKSFFPAATSSSGTLLIDANIDFTTLGIVTGVDYIHNITTDTNTTVINTVSATQLTFTTGTFTSGDVYEIIDGSDGSVKYPVDGAKLYFKDGNSDYSSPRSRLPSTTDRRIIWRALGSSRERTYKLSFVGTSGIKLFGLYVILTGSSREL